MWERWKSELKSWEILCLVSTRGSGQEMGFVVREFSSHASHEGFWIKTMKSFQQLQASFSLTDQFGEQFVHEISPRSSKRIMHWTSQKKSLRSGPVKILISSLQLAFTRACYIHYFDWLLSDIESVIVFHYFFETGTSSLRSGTLLVPFQQRLQISFQRKKKSIFQDTVYSLHPTENLWQNMTLWLVYEISVLRLLLFF